MKRARFSRASEAPSDALPGALLGHVFGFFSWETKKMVLNRVCHRWKQTPATGGTLHIKNRHVRALDENLDSILDYFQPARLVTDCLAFVAPVVKRQSSLVSVGLQQRLDSNDLPALVHALEPSTCENLQVALKVKDCTKANLVLLRHLNLHEFEIGHPWMNPKYNDEEHEPDDIVEDRLELLSSYTQLRDLCVADHYIVSLNFLSAFSELRVFEIRSESLENDALAALSTLPKLQKLTLNCSRITDNGISFLGSIASLRSLSVLGLKHITEQAIEHLPQLQDLDLRYTGADMNRPALWSRMQRLTRLNISVLPITDAQLRCLKGATALRHLYLGANYVVTGEGLKHLVKLPLVELDLGSCPQITAFEALAAFQSLRVLNLRRAKLGESDRALDYLPLCLQELCLCYTKLQNVGVSKLSKLVQLRKLGMYSCRHVTDEALVVLKELPCLELVDCFRTSITECKLLSLPNILANRKSFEFMPGVVCG